jgi:hypothetical protein
MSRTMPTTRDAIELEAALRDADAWRVMCMLERAVALFGVEIARTWTFRSGSSSVCTGGTLCEPKNCFPSPQEREAAAGQAVAGGGGGGAAVPPAAPLPNPRERGGPNRASAPREMQKTGRRAERCAPAAPKVRKRRRKSASARRASSARAKAHRLRAASSRQPPGAASGAPTAPPAAPDQPSAAVPATVVAERAGGLKRAAPDVVDDVRSLVEDEGASPTREPRPRPRAAEAGPETRLGSIALGRGDDVHGALAGDAG